MNRTEDGWIVTPGVDASALESSLASKLEAHFENKNFLPDEVRYVSEKKLIGISSSLKISKERLEKLRALCQLWEIQLLPGQITSHRRILGPFIVGVKRVLFPVLRFILKDMIRQQRSFNAACVALLADLTNEEKVRDL